VRPLTELSQDDRATIVNYEEIVMDFPAWLSKVLYAVNLQNDEALTRIDKAI